MHPSVRYSTSQDIPSLSFLNCQTRALPAPHSAPLTFLLLYATSCPTSGRQELDDVSPFPNSHHPTIFFFSFLFHLFFHLFFFNKVWTSSDRRRSERSSERSRGLISFAGNPPHRLQRFHSRGPDFSHNLLLPAFDFSACVCLIAHECLRL